jgi:large conductance mechanosensitive channel
MLRVPLFTWSGLHPYPAVVESRLRGNTVFPRSRDVTTSDGFHSGGLGPSANAEHPTMKKIVDEFREFALKGNVLDMAIGIIIGGAFGTIVQSLVKDVIMPPIGLLIGGVDFSDIKIALRAATEGKEAVTMNVGVFINNVISFLVVAWAVFMLVKGINMLRERFEKEKAAAPPPPPAPSELYLKEIRDALVKN